MAKTKTSSAVKRRYNEKSYDFLSVTIPKGRKSDLKAHVGEKQTVNGLVNDLLMNELGMDEAEWKRKPEAGDPNG